MSETERKKYGQHGDDGAPFMPTEEEIIAAREAIKASWSPHEERSRRVGYSLPERLYVTQVAHLGGCSTVSEHSRNW